MWIHTYMDPPEFFSVDQGSNDVSREFKEDMEAAGITLKEAPIETPGSIGTVERYHAPRSCALNMLRVLQEEDDSTDAEYLQMAVYATSATMGAERLRPMLLVFGVLPRSARSCPPRLCFNVKSSSKSPVRLLAPN